MSQIAFDVNVANGVAIDIDNDVLSVWWMEVYPYRFNQWKSLYMPKLNDSVIEKAWSVSHNA